MNFIDTSEMLINNTSDKRLLWLVKGNHPYFLLFIIISALYFKTLFFQFTFFDDHVLIQNRLNFFKDFSNILKIFNEDVFNSYNAKFYYRPLLTGSFFIDGWIGGGKLWIFHLTNIIYHLLTCFLLFELLKQLKFSKLNSFFVTVIFSVHPLAVQVVAWIPGRNDSLLAIFILLSFISSINYLEKNRLRFLFASVFMFSAALLTKEQAVFFPIIVLLYFLWFNKTSIKKLMFLLFVFLCLTVCFLFIRNEVLGKMLGATNITEIIKSIWQNLPAIPAYLGKIFIPWGLSVYPHLNDLQVQIILGCILVLFIGLSFLLKARDQNMMLFGLAWFIIFLVPGFIKAVNISEHRVYLPLIGLLIFISAILKDTGIKQALVFISVFIIFSIVSFSYSSHFRNKLTLWQQAVKSSPSSAFNANNLGAMYYLENDQTNAEKFFRKALAINPDERLANGNLGLVLMNNGKLDEAESCLLKEIQINPAYDHAYFNLGILNMKKNNIQQALEYMVRTIQVNPHYVDAYRNLILFYRQSNQPEYEQAVIDLANKNGIKF